MLKVEPISQANRGAWLEMRIALYPDEPAHIIESEIDSFLRTGMIAGRKHGVLLALSDNSPVGFIETSEISAHRCHVESWYVTPHARRSGVGRALVIAGESWARAHGMSVLTSDTNEDYPDSPPAHKACGFDSTSNDTLFAKPISDQS